MKELNRCFEPLFKRLYEIEFKTSQSSLDFQNYLITEIIDGGVLGFNSEDTLMIINIHLDKINVLQPKLNSLVSNVEFKKEEVNPFAEYFNPISKQNEALSPFELLYNSLKDELNFYAQKLNVLKTQIEDYNDKIGSDRFSNAGFKIRLNLTVEEIGCMFGLFYEEGIIDKSDVNKKQLCNYISKNFLSKNKQDELSSKSLENVLNYKTNKSCKKISDKLRELDKFLNS